MADAGLASLADARVLYLTTVGRRSGQPRTIEIWFTCYQGKLYLNAERAQNANWVRNILQHPEVQVRLKEQQFAGRARVLDRQADRVLWDTVAHLSRQKYGWGEGLPVEITLRILLVTSRKGVIPRGSTCCQWRLRYGYCWSPPTVRCQEIPYRR